MRQLNMWFLGVIILVFAACGPASDGAQGVEFVENKQSLPPHERFGPVFEAVQAGAVFADSKTFVDAIPKYPTDQILAAYSAQKDEPEFHLKAFVLDNFTLPADLATDFKSDPMQALPDHLNRLWPVLTRKPAASDAGSLIGLPFPYVVPGGRFREIYYWDSYFTMLGLKSAGRVDLVEDMVNNFAFLIDSLGFIPNGNRTYYLTRSQPPFFALMVDVLAEVRGEDQYRILLPQLLKEYNFWMDGLAELTPEQPAVRHVVRLADGQILNRYYDAGDYPRAEAYREDVATAQASGRPLAEVYRHLRSGAESGWDYSSRWLADGRSLATIETTDIIPVDLNALLYHLEKTLEKAFTLAGNAEQSAAFAQRAQQRHAALQAYCWDAGAGYFQDYHWKHQRATGRTSLAGVFPLFLGLASPQQAAACAQVLERDFLRPGGLVTTAVNTGQQWDAPNGWAPLQWVAVSGLRRYDQDALATTIEQRWVALNEQVFRRTGKMLEKYNVEDLSLEAGGGEYPVQDGFGWTNGVLMQMLSQ